MVDRLRTVQGLQVPAFMYGTAWKEDDTAALVARALDAGFRAIDTANQRRHYVEAGVGEAVADAIARVQNRCFARAGWDYTVRALCSDLGIVYQGFSLLTAYIDEITTPGVRRIAARHGRTIPQIVFRFAFAVGMLPLTGTSDAEH